MSKQDHAAPPLAPSPVTGGQSQDFDICIKLIAQLWAVRQTMREREKALKAELDKVLPGYHQSARNLVHYLTLRSVDLRPLQEQLSRLGLSSLGRSESHVLASLDKVLGLLHRLTGQSWDDKSDEEPAASAAVSCLKSTPSGCSARPPPDARFASWSRCPPRPPQMPIWCASW